MSQETKDLILRSVNAAVSSQLGRKLPQAVAEGVTTAITPLQEQISQLGQNNAAGAPANQRNGQGNQGGQPNPELANQVKALQNQVKESEQKRLEEAQRHQETAIKSELRSQLGQAGVRAELIEGAVATLRPNLVRTDEGIFWRAQRQGYHEDLGVQAGILEWASSDVGKAHLAPKQFGGSGAQQQRGTGPKPGNEPIDPKLAAAQRRQVARKTLFQQMGSLIASGPSVNLTGPGPIAGSGERK